MTTRREEFFTELAALMEKHKVELEVREDCSNYSCMADGIDFDFNALPYAEDESVDRDADRNYYTVTWEGKYFDADIMRTLAVKGDEK